MNNPNDKHAILYDEVNVARLKTVDLFREFFVEIHPASTERQLFDMLSDEAFDADLIIFNDSFDNNRGFDILSKIKDINADTPVLVLTTNDKKEIFLKIISEGICDYLLKPYSENMLLERVLNITNSNKTNISPKKIHFSNEVAFDINDYIRSELRKAEKGNFEISILMLKLFVPAINNKIKNQDKHMQISDLFYKKIAEILWETDVIERMDLNTFIGVFPFCGVNNISKVYNKIIECFDNIKKENIDLIDFHLVLNSATYPSKKVNAENIIKSLEISIEKEMEKINGLILKFK